VTRRGRIVPGTSAKKARATRRQRRGEADRLRRAGATPPAVMVAPEDLEALARQHRQQQEAPDD
jgi:hypothetical protein